MDDVRIYNYGLTAAEVSTLNAGLAPAMPTGLTLSAPSPSNIVLQWNDVASNEAGYLVERRPASGGGSTLLERTAFPQAVAHCP